MKRRIAIAVLIVVAVVVVMFSAAIMQRHRVLNTYGLELYWSANQAYLFVGENRLGWNLTPSEVIDAYVRSLVRYPIPVTDTRRSLTIVWFTKDAIDTQVFEGVETHPFIKIVNGALFLDSNRKWSRARLERTTAEEQQLYDSAPLPPGPEYTNFKGWSKSCCRGLEDSRLSNVPFVLDGERVELIIRSESLRGRKQVLLQRASGITPILTLNDEPRRVSREEYFELMTAERR